jgi:hypothetical protein
MLCKWQPPCLMDAVKLDLAVRGGKKRVLINCTLNVENLVIRLSLAPLKIQHKHRIIGIGLICPFLPRVFLLSIHL